MEINTSIAVDEPQPLTYAQITLALQVGVNTFMKTHIHNIIKHLTSNSITTSHIMSTFTNEIAVDLGHIFNWLTPYSNLNKLAEDHIMANVWPKGEEFNLAARRHCMELVAQGADKFNTLITDGSVHHTVFIKHMLQWFIKNGKCVVKSKLEEAKKILSSLSVKSSQPPTSPNNSIMDTLICVVPPVLPPLPSPPPGLDLLAMVDSGNNHS
jgi:hypothetical protein